VSWVFLDAFFTDWLVVATIPMSDKKKKKKPNKRGKKGAAKNEEDTADYAVSTIRYKPFPITLIKELKVGPNNLTVADHLQLCKGLANGTIMLEELPYKIKDIRCKANVKKWIKLVVNNTREAMHTQESRDAETQLGAQAPFALLSWNAIRIQYGFRDDLLKEWARSFQTTEANLSAANSRRRAVHNAMVARDKLRGDDAAFVSEAFAPPRRFFSDIDQIVRKDAVIKDVVTLKEKHFHAVVTLPNVDGNPVKFEVLLMHCSASEMRYAVPDGVTVSSPGIWINDPPQGILDPKQYEWDKTPWGRDHFDVANSVMTGMFKDECVVATYLARSQMEDCDKSGIAAVSHVACVASVVVLRDRK
jgi:hypothetical protein